MQRERLKTGTVRGGRILMLATVLACHGPLQSETVEYWASGVDKTTGSSQWGLTPLTENVDNSSTASSQDAKIPKRRQTDVSDLKTRRRRLVPARECGFFPPDDTLHKRCRADDSP